MRRDVLVIETDDAKRYRETLYALRKRMIRAFDDTSDGSLRRWINHHGPILDELIEELGGRPS
jgi:hypothetical protein